VEGSCEYGNELSDSIKCWEVLGVAAQLVASQEGLSSISKCQGASHRDSDTKHVTSPKGNGV
jgi:hypothetical protein